MNLHELEEVFEDVHVVKKMLHVMLEKYNHVVVVIEMLVDLNTISIEKIVGRLHVVQDKYDVEEVVYGIGQRLLTEVQWETCRRQCRGKEHAHKNDTKNGDIIMARWTETE
ncbi:hypothetical protein GUJ93_ZPchr0014g46909 [Zizania palustris]|uniref:Uncharacterized protein n=1 Tax=Zizania palustris TaxID=103762 RepID=A0A8J5VRP9_ZIZPA|nr:hypothetical protein GUJ93_ZPchr0014g46909 [Zizania palustris]